jgi:hypothetical protein
MRETGNILEHRDRLPPIAEKAPNANGML